VIHPTDIQFEQLAKCLKYLGFTTICDIIFGVFIFSWLLTRHVFYLMICWSIYSDVPRLLTPACYRGTADNLQGPFPVPENGWSHLLDPFRDPAGTLCYTNNIMLGFLSYLLFLQVMMIMWFALIIRVAMRVLKGDSAEDLRSDAEVEEEESEYEKAQPLEEEVGVEAIDLKGWERRSSAKRAATSSSSVSLPRHSSDRKELLNRIGCEKQID
jgi:very-long-chain ceramide synthase